MLKSKGSLPLDVDINALNDELVKYGLTKLQAKCYLGLLMLGPTTARNISKVMNINKVDTYRVLKELSNKGLVEVMLANPSIYQPILPEDAVRILVEEYESKLISLKSKAGELVSKLKLVNNIILSYEGYKKIETFFTVLNGTQFIQKLKVKLKEAKKEVVRIISPRGIKVNILENLPEIEKNLTRNGIKIRFLTEVSKEIIEDLKYYSSIVDIRHLERSSLSLRYTVIDAKEAFISAADPPTFYTKGPCVIWTNNRILVNALVQDFEEKWVRSMNIE